MWLRVQFPVRALCHAAWILSTLGLFIGCSALLDVPKPALDTRGGAGISITLCPLLGFCRKPQQLLVIELNDSRDVLAPRQVLLSKWTFGEDGFLLNTPPGTYGVVGAIFTLSNAIGPMAVPPRPGDWGTYTVYFPETMVSQTVREIAAGTLSFMGRYEVKMLPMGELDRVQSFYFQIFERSGKVYWEELEPISGYLLWAIKGRPVVAIEGGSGLGSQMARGIAIGQYSYQGRLDQAAVGKEQEIAFWQALETLRRQ
jgi:hypothetical protein